MKLSIMLVLSMFFVSCATSINKTHKLKKGMDLVEFENFMGNPHSTMMTEKYTVKKYRMSEAFQRFDEHDFYLYYFDSADKLVYWEKEQNNNMKVRFLD